jgi:hypothetical protein
MLEPMRDRMTSYWVSAIAASPSAFAEIGPRHRFERG